MKKKSSPVILVSVIVILFSAVGMWNAFSAGIFKPSMGKPQIKAGQKEGGDTVASDVKNQLGGPQEAPAPAGHKQVRNADEGSLLVPPSRAVRRHSSATTSQKSMWKSSARFVL